MSTRFTKQKYVACEVLEDLSLPEENQDIVKVIGSRGNNLHEVETPDGETYLVSMPTKFRRHIWIKRKDFVVVEPIAEGNKVKAEIVRVLYREQIRHFKKQGKWPPEFDDKNSAEETSNTRKKESPSGSDEDSDSDGDLFVNTNRLEDRVAFLSVSSETSDSEEEESSQEEETG